MHEFETVLAGCELFSGIAAQDRSALLHCLGARVNTFRKNQVILAEGDPAVDMGVVLRGAVQIVRDDFYGNRSIVDRMGPGALFGESFACAGVEALPVSAVAAEDSEILLLNCRQITATCSKICGFHNRIIRNLLGVVANKNLLVHRKLEITSRRSTREKLMAYLLYQSKQAGSREFTIPYDRQGLADYLGVERSAMSAELGKLRRDGVLECSRSRFRLLR